MLKLIGTLKNGSCRLGSRSLNRCMNNYQMVSPCSSVASRPETDIGKVTETKTETRLENKNVVKEQSKNKVTDVVFNSLKLLDDSTAMSKEDNDRLQLVTGILHGIEQGTISYDRAKTIIDILHEWVKNGKIKLTDFDKNPTYHKLCNILTRESKKNMGGMIFPNNNMVSENLTALELYPFNESFNDIEEIPVAQAIKLLSSLTIKQQRIRPLLRAIANNINRSKTQLSIKNIGDVLYCMAMLRFPDSELLCKLTNDLKESINTISQSSIIGSIITSLGMLRYRDDALLNEISEWVVQNKSILRTQDLCALLMTLATVGYTPVNSDVLFTELVSTLSETEMVKSSDWVDVIWALTILNRVTSEQIDSVLNTRFLNTLSSLDDIPLVKKHKLLNINSAAKLLMTNYSGSFLPDDSKIFHAPILNSKEKQIYIRSIIDALANLFPSREYFRTNIKSDTGFLIDIEFSMNKKLAPLPTKKIPECTDVLRVAIMGNYYHDYSLGNVNLLGPILLHYKLLKAKGYQLMDISHEVYHPDDKLLTRISYINDRIKKLVK